MTDTRDMTLGGRTFAVPRLPLKATMRVYPLCRKLTVNGLVDRCAAAGGVLDCSEEEMAEVAEIAFLCAASAEDGLTQEVFDALPISPPELLDAFFTARYQTGAWVAPEAKPEGDASGEAKGEASPPT